jgi:hypothetical protein
LSRSTQKSAALTSAQNLLRGAREPWLALSTARLRIPASDIQALVKWMPNARGKSGPVTSSRLPKRLELFRRLPPLNAVPLHREVAWVVAQIVEEAARLTHFVGLKSAFEQASCLGDARACFGALDAIEKDLGFSFWSIEARIGALQMHEGLEAQKNHLSKILKILPGSDVVSFFAYHVSRRFEPSTVPTRFSGAFAEMTSRWDDADGLDTYLNFRVAGIAPISAMACANLCRYETPGSIVDQYETFVSMARTASIVDDDETARAFDPAVARVAQLVQDERLNKIILLRGNLTALSHLTFVADPATDLVLEGNFIAADERIASCINSRPNDPALWRRRADIADALGEVIPSGSSPAESTPRLLQALSSEEHEGEREIVPLLRLALGFHNLSFAPSLLVYAYQALPSRKSTGIELGRIAFIERPGARPDDVALLPSAIRPAYLKAAAAALLPTPSLTRAAVIAGQPTEGMPDLCPEERFRAEVEALLLNGDTQAALAALLPRVEGQDVGRSRWAIREAANAMAALNENVELARFIVTHAARRPGIVRSLPVTDCVMGLDEDMRTGLLRELTLPIILHLAAETDDNFTDARAYAYEDFLIAQGLDRPSQLDTMVGDHDPTLLSYYLRYICVPEIMQVSSEFQSTRELQEERIAVLRLLVEIDPANVKIYEDDLREITRSLLVHSGVRHIGQTKIFVDVPALRRWAERNLREDFSRFQSLLQVGLGIDRELVAAMLHRLAQRKPVPNGMLELPKNEATDLLVKMVVTLNREFLNNPDHGLDCYLSMRIRHGTLAGQLRTPLEVEHLITQRRVGSDDYTSNEQWIAALRLHRIDPQAIDLRLASFSRDYDDLIAEISNDLIQIRSPERPEGLFDGGIRTTQLLLLATDLTQELSFETFLDLCFDIYWSRVDVCLTAVRDVCNEQIKPRISRMFNSLESEIATLAGTARSDLETAIRSAATGANQALDIVADWFRLPAPIEVQVFPIEAMVDVGLKCVTTIYPEFHPTLRKKIKPALPPFGDALAFFSDVFFIVFDNIRRHSGLANPKVELTVEQIDADEGELRPRLRFLIESDVGNEVNAAAIETRLLRIRERIETDDYRSAVVSEGGTGLIKLHRILGRRNLEANMLTFGLSNGRFFVDFKIFWRETAI